MHGYDRRTVTTLAAIFIGVVALWDTRIVYPLKVLVVLLHEISHGLATVLTGGSIEGIEVNAQQGGVCLTRGGIRFLTLSAGYLGSMLFGAAILLIASRTRRDRQLCNALGIFLGLVTLLYVRPAFGFGFNFGLLASTAMVVGAWKLPEDVLDFVMKTVGLTSCLYAIVDIKSDILDRPHVTSDAVLLADEVRFVPAVVWGFLWIVAAIAVTVAVVRASARGEGPSPSGRGPARELLGAGRSGASF